MTICIAGKNNIAVTALSFVLEHYPNEKIIVICNQDDEGLNTWQKSLRYFAIKNSVEIKTLEDVYAIQDLLFLSLEFDTIVKPSLFTTKRLYNIHFSLLPAYKGMFTSIMPILYGENTSGVTLHKIDEGIDTGDIIDQIYFEILERDTARDLYQKYLENGIQLFIKNIGRIIASSYTSNQQPSVKASYFSKKTIDFKNITIDIKKTAFEIHNQIRAFTFRDYQLPSIGEHRIYKSEILPIASNKKQNGKFEKIDDYSIQIEAIDYKVRAYIDFEEDLFEYAKTGDIAGIKHLKENGYDIYVRNRLGWNILIVAAYNEHLELTKYLIKEEGFDVNDANYKGTTVLMYAMTAASKSNNLVLLEYLFTQNAEIQAQDDKGLTLLDYAKQYSNPQIIQFIQNKYDKVS